MVAFASERFRQALKHSHTVATQMIATRGQTRVTVDYLGGRITQSYDDASRWSIDVDLLVPSTFSVDGMRSFLNTRLTTLKPYRGIRYDSDGSTELIEFASFYITSMQLNEAINGAPVFRLSGFDRSVRAQGDLSNTINIPLNSSPASYVPIILNRKIPNASYALAATNYRTPYLALTPDMDAWDEATRLMQSVGHSLYFDRSDRCVSSPRALVPSSEYVWHYDENNFSDFWNVERVADNDLYPNVVRVVSTNPSTPNIVGEASDLNPNSPTYRYGDYGEQIRTFRSEQVTTAQQANTMAQYLLSKLLGPQDQVTFEAIPNPTLDVGDTVRITRSSLGLFATPLLVTEIEMPLTATGSMKATARRSLFSEITTMPVRT